MDSATRSTCLRRVLFFDHSLVIGGAEKSLLDIVCRAQGFEPVLVTPSPVMLSEFESAGIECIFFPVPQVVLNRKRERLVSVSDMYNLPSLVVRLAKLLRRENASLIYTNTQKAHVIGVIAGRLAGIPSVSHFRDILPKSVLTRIWLCLLCLLASRVIAISRAVAAELPESRKVVVIHNGIDPELPISPRSASTGRSTVSSTPQTVGYVGQIARWKGVQDFIEAAGQVAKQVPEVSFVIVGGPIFGDLEYLSELEKLIRDLGLETTVRLVGSKADALPYIRDLSILVHPSRAPEPFGRVLIEAAALGKPIIATNTGAIPEIVKDNETGILVPPANPSLIAEALMKLTNDPELARSMGDAGKERVRKQFNVSGMMEKIEKVMGEVC
jgi:glycosyltransferase involved in cell wall biosynthesis